MALGTRWILGVATWFGGIDGALRPIMAPHGWVIPALSLGALWLILWPARARWLGLTAVIAALVGWGLTTRPALLIDGDGALVGLMTPAGRALSRARGAGYTARAWLEADGDGADQATAALRAGFTPVEGGVAFTFDGAPWLHLPGRRGARALAGHCHGGVRIVTDARLTTPPQGNCSVLDASVLAATGAVAYRQAGARQTAHNQSGQRPWAAP